MGLAASHRDTVVVFACSIVIILFLFRGGLFGRCFLFFLRAHVGLAAVTDEVGELVFEVLAPLAPTLLESIVGLILLFEERFRQGESVGAVLELSLGDL